MFNIGPLELVVLAIVGLVVLGPDKLPGLARDAARMIRTLRELATGARQQLRDELGPEFADVDLRNLNPRHAISRVLLGDEFSDSVSNTDFRKYDPRRFDARQAARDFFEDDGDDSVADNVNGSVNGSSGSVNFDKPATRSQPTSGVNGDAGAKNARPRPRPRPSTQDGAASNGGDPTTPYDTDAT